MRDARKRHLTTLLRTLERRAHVDLASIAPLPRAAEKPVPVAPPEMDNRDYVAYLLTIDAEIEHALMVQYLYAAWSLGGPQVPEDKRALVAGWQKTILGIAKEEMGHLICVQNVLRLIGAPLYLGREDYPWDTPFYPFPFMLEPASLDTLAKYVFAESPEAELWRGRLQEDVLRRVRAQVDEPKRVGALFELLIELVGDDRFLPDETFQADSRPFQADFSEWGRGYDGSKVPPPDAGTRPDVLVVPLASRDDAVAALTSISEQGEDTRTQATADGSGRSHFARFVEVYEGVAKALAEGWVPWRDVAVNPYVPSGIDDPGAEPAGGEVRDVVADAITHPESRLWAHLFNVRYRMLLQLLMHSFELADGSIAAGTKNPRGVVIHATFGEMYNLRAIGHILVQSPLSEGSPGRFAGAPFLVPYSFALPQEEANRWRRHQDLIRASRRLASELAPMTSPTRQAYLRSLEESDRALLSTIDPMLAALASPR